MRVCRRTFAGRRHARPCLTRSARRSAACLLHVQPVDVTRVRGRAGRRRRPRGHRGAARDSAARPCRSPSSCGRPAPTASWPPASCSRSACSRRPTTSARSSTARDQPEPDSRRRVRENVVNVTLADACRRRLGARAGRSPPGDDELVVRDVRAADDRVAARRSCAPIACGVDDRRARSLAACPTGCARARRSSTKPADCTPPGSSRVTAGSMDVAEDVGRHNAVDKVVGRMLMRDALPLSDHAALRQRPHVVRDRAEGALRGHSDRRRPCRRRRASPSSSREEAGITLVGFVRGDGFNIYTHPERIASDGYHEHDELVIVLRLIRMFGSATEAASLSRDGCGSRGRTATSCRSRGAS